MINDSKRDFVYGAAMQATRDHRRKLIQFWLDSGDNPTEGEEKQIESETETLKLIAGRAANLALIALDSADNFIEINEMVDEANARGYDLVKRDDDEEEEV